MQKFTDIELKQLLRRGMTGTEIAKHLGVSKSTVSGRIKALNIAVSKDITIRSAGEIVRTELDTIGQLQKINRDANELLDLLMRWNRGDDEALQILETQVRKVKIGRGEDAEEITEYKFKDPRELALNAMREIRGQLKLQLEIFQALYDMQAVQQFQSEVLEIIGNVAPDARDEIIRRLTQANAIRSALDLN
ncbi:MAG: winged helix-turn-helix domain-containing protein [Syntrophobacteraceae bacterium]